MRSEVVGVALAMALLGSRPRSRHDGIAIVADEQRSTRITENPDRGHDRVPQGATLVPYVIPHEVKSFASALWQSATNR
jgi:hypothetical protein